MERNGKCQPQSHGSSCSQGHLGIAVSYILERMEATSETAWGQQGYLEGTALGRGPGHHMYAGPSGRPGFPATLL